MKLHHLFCAVFVALLSAAAAPAALYADTIYYRIADVPDIKTISGTIVRETNKVVEIQLADGHKVSIPRDDVYEIVRGAPATQMGAGSSDGLEDFSEAAALARGEMGDSQSSSTLIYDYGFLGGLATSNVRADPQELEESGSLRGYAAGFWYGVGLSHHLMIRSELLFSMKGDSESASGYTASTHLSYIEVPVLAKIDILPNAPVKPSFFAGPSMAFNLSAKAKLEGEGMDSDVDVKDQVAAFEFGLVAGGGLGFGVGGKTLGVDLRYSRGLSDVGDGVVASAHNEAVALMLSIGLR